MLTFKSKKDGPFELIRFEDLMEDVNTLNELSEFIGLEPKLQPQLSLCLEKFDRLTKKGTVRSIKLETTSSGEKTHNFEN